MPATVEAIALLILFVAPGFLCARAIRADMPSTFTGERNSLILSVIFSAFIHVLLLPYTWEMKNDIQGLVQDFYAAPGELVPTFRWSVFVWLLIVLFIAPISIALILSRLWRSAWAQPMLSRFGISLVQLTPTAWDWLLLSQKEGCWVVAEMDDGSLVGGEFGRESFASLSPHRADLFLERGYYVDEMHNFGDMRPDTIGVWINGDRVRNLHLYRVEAEG